MAKLPVKKSPTSDSLRGVARYLAAFGAFFCLALIIYWPALGGPYIWDDAEMVRPASRGLGAIWGGHLIDYLPMTSSVLWAGWHMWGDNPLGYRLLNVGLHAANAALVFEIVRRLRCPGAWIAAAIFCVHPVCAGTVAWIAEIKNTLSLFFALVTVWFFVRSQVALIHTGSSPSSGSATDEKTARGLKVEKRGRSKEVKKSDIPAAGATSQGLRPRGGARDYLLALFSFLLALLSKISVVMLPFVLAGFYYWLRRPGLQIESGQEKTRGTDAGSTARRTVFSLISTAPFFGLSLVLGLISVWFQRHHAMTIVSESEYEPLMTRLLGGGYALWFYLGKTILPLNLMPIYPHWEIKPASVTDWIPGLLWLGLLLGCWWVASVKRKTTLKASGGPEETVKTVDVTRPLLDTPLKRGVNERGHHSLNRRWQVALVMFWGLSFFSIMLLPVLGLAQISYFFISRAADHLQYLPLAGVLAAAGYALGKPARSSQIQTSKFIVAGGLIVLLGLASWQRAKLFANPEELWRDNIARNPRAAMAWANLGEVVNGKGRHAEALDAYRQAIKLDPGNLPVRETLGGAYAAAGRFDEAIAEYREVLTGLPRNPRAHNNLGAVLARKGLYELAVTEFKTTLELVHDFPEARKNLGAAYYRLGRYAEAIEELERVLESSPDFPIARQILLEAQRQKAAATNGRPQ